MAKKATKADKQAVKNLIDARDEAIKDMEKFKTKQSFEMAGQCLDKNGENTKVLTVDTDREGILGLFIELGNPFSINEKGDIDEDKALAKEYLEFMSNVDLSKTENLEACGWNSIPKAREVVRSFFMLRLVSDINLTGVAES